MSVAVLAQTILFKVLEVGTAMNQKTAFLKLALLCIALSGVCFGVSVKQKLGIGRVGAGDETGTERTRFRGGVRQRIAEAESAAGSSSTCPRIDTELPLIKDLVRDWGKGLVSSEQVQRYSLRAAQQGAGGLDALGNLGSQCHNPQNIFRGLCNLLGYPSGSCPISFIEVPSIHGRKSAHPVLWPHDFFGTYYAHQKPKFSVSVCPGARSCRQFWRSIQDSDFVRLHPTLLENDFKNAVPLGVHMDGGAFNKQDSIYVISWNSLIGSGQTRANRFIFTAMRKSELWEGRGI